MADQDLARLARRLDHSARDAGLGHAIVHDALCRIFLVTLVQHYAIEDTHGGQFDRHLSVRRFASLQDYIEHRISGPIRVADMAAHVGMSEAVFARELKASVGETPARFVLRARVRKARRLLVESSDPIGRIAAACGFSDQAHLARSFRRQTGRSPLAYRQATTTDHADRPSPENTIGAPSRRASRDIAEVNEIIQKTDLSKQSGMKGRV